jgi:histidinol dehydrogenase
MRRIATGEGDFEGILESLARRGESDFGDVEETVREIIADVRKRGDDALIDLASRFDATSLTPQTLRVAPGEIDEAVAGTPPEVLELMRSAAGRIRDFHREQVRRSWFVTDDLGGILGQHIVPMASAGLYVPGGTAVYPSTVLMNAIPALVAGVGRIAICTPARNGRVNPLVLAAADVVGVREIYKTGGAQAIAAMAYGTAAIAPVSKIVGPGNIWVAMAKRLVYGRVSIDSIAGPSEVFIVADDSADPEFVAADLLSQAEHDVMATCVLLTDSAALADRVTAAVGRQVAHLTRRELAMKSLQDRGWIILTATIEEAVRISNRLGPEHLEILVRDPLSQLPAITYAGSVFLGPWTPEPIGDYIAGPNHVLPTGGAARFSSSLGVDDFVVRSNIVHLKREGFEILAGMAATFADLEGLDAHARSIRIRKRDA